MTTHTLTSVERVQRALERRDHDRIPRYDHFWNETIENWQQQGFDGDYAAALEALGTDMHLLCWYWPMPFPGPEVVIEEDEQTKVVRDGNGGLIRLWKHKSGTPEHLGWECTGRDVWEQRFRPALVEQPIQVDLDQIKKEFAHAQKTQRWSHIDSVEPFECIRKILGDEVFMMSIIEDPELIRDIGTTCVDNVLRNFQALLDAGVKPDGLWIFGDMAYRSSTFCSPKQYRELIWPEHQRLAEFAHANGMKVIYHTDGNVNGVIDLYLEAGFDCLQPLEAKAGMDIRELVPKYGDRLSFFGNIDIMVLMTNDREKIEQEVRSKLEAGMASHGYIYHSDHSIPPQVTWQTYRFVIELLDRYGMYQ